MADARVIDRISEHVTCPLCLEKYTEPKSLPCQHTFCFKCLDRHAKRQTVSGSFPCPLCRKSTCVPRGGVSSFCTNFTLQNIAEDIEAQHSAGVDIQEKKPIFCDSCKSNGKTEEVAVGECGQCEEALCQDCIDAHARLKITRNHTITLLNNPDADSYSNSQPSTSKSPAPQSSGKEAWVCAVHTGEDVTHYCLPCSTPLCARCMAALLGTGQHTGHDVTSRELAPVLAQQQLRQQLSKVTRLRSDLSEDVKHVTALKTQLQTDRTRTVDEINDIKRLVTDWADRMTAKVNQIATEKDQIFNTTAQNLETNMASLEEGQRKLKDDTQLSSVNLLKRKATLQTEISALCGTAAQDAALVPKSIKLTLADGKLSERALPGVQALLGDVRYSSSERGEDSAPPGGAALEAETSQPSTSTAPVHVYGPAHTQRLAATRVLKGKMGAICFTKDGRFLAIYEDEEEVCHFTVSRDYVFTLVTRFGGEILQEPCDLAELPNGQIAVCDVSEDHSIKVFDSFTATSGQVTWYMSGQFGRSLLRSPLALTGTPDGDLFVSDTHRRTVYGLELNGVNSCEKTVDVCQHYDHFDTPWFIASAPHSGDLAVSDHDRNCVKVFTKFGKFKWRYGEGSVMRRPKGVCFDEDERLYVCDMHHHRIHVVDKKGVLIANIPFTDCWSNPPDPDMVKLTPYGDIALGNSRGWVFILKVCFTGN